MQRLPGHGQPGEQRGLEFVRGDARVSKKRASDFAGRDFVDGDGESGARVAAGRCARENSSRVLRRSHRHSLRKIDKCIRGNYRIRSASGLDGAGWENRVAQASSLRLFGKNKWEACVTVDSHFRFLFLNSEIFSALRFYGQDHDYR